MKALLYFLAAFFCCNQSSAQDRSFITLKAGTSINDGVPVADLYQYLTFTDGKVYFRDGHVTDAKLNYHKYLDEMQFVNYKGDTLTVDNEETIKLIVVANDTFYYYKNYIRHIATADKLKLGARESLQIADEKKASAYDMTSSVSSIKAANTFSDGRYMTRINVKTDILLGKITYYYFGDEYNRFMPASKKNLFELLPKKRNQIKEYLRTNEVNFSNKNDLEKLLLFLRTLSE